MSDVQVSSDIPLDEMPPEIRAMVQQFLDAEAAKQPLDKQTRKPGDFDLQYLSEACYQYERNLWAERQRSDFW